MSYRYIFKPDLFITILTRNQICSIPHGLFTSRQVIRCRSDQIRGLLVTMHAIDSHSIKEQNDVLSAENKLVD